MKTTVFLITLLWINHSIRGKTIRVLNGLADSRNEFPFVVVVERETPVVPDYTILRLCSGSLISSNWVLTAAHCFFSTSLVVRYGNVSVPRNETECVRPVLKIVRHPYYRTRGKVINDIGLLLIEKVDMSIGKISAVNFPTLLGFPVRYAGFGMKTLVTIHTELFWEHVEKDLMTPLQIGTGVISKCLDRDSKRFFPAMCVWPKCSDQFHSPYWGDSGGPVFVGSKIVAVISAGVPGSFAIATPVEPFIEWISQTVSTK